MRLVGKLEFCWIVIDKRDKSLCGKTFKNCPPVRLQICAGTCQQIAKDRNFYAREIICHQIGPR